MDRLVGACIVRENTWTLLYLGGVLDCDVPILEAIWHSYGVWQEETEQALLKLLSDTLRERMQAAYPRWKPKLQDRRWSLHPPTNVSPMRYLCVQIVQTAEFRFIQIVAMTLNSPNDVLHSASFTVEWKRNKPELRVGIDRGESKSPINFSALFEQQMQRFENVYVLYKD